MATVARQSFLTAIQSHLGQPYVFGGTSANATDCSGLIFYVLQGLGITSGVPRTSQDQWAALPHIEQSQAQPGDLVFFPGASGTAAQPDHVGICSNVGCTQMIDDPHTGASVEVDATSGATGFASLSSVLSGTVTTGISGSLDTPGGSCSGVSLLGACLFPKGQQKAVISGLAVAAGGAIFGVGVLLVTSYALSDTKAGRAAGASARRTLSAGRGSRRRAVRTGRRVGRIPGQVSDRRARRRLESVASDYEEQKADKGYQQRRRRYQRDILGQSKAAETLEQERSRRQREGFGEAA